MYYNVDTMPHRAFKTQCLHYDSISASYIKDVNNTSSSNTNAYKANFPMNQTFCNIKRVYLTSVEVPVGFSNIRKGSTDTLKFTLNGTSYSVTLAGKNYSAIATLITDLNTACVGIVSGVTITFSLTSSLTTPNRLLITFTGGTTTSSFSIIDTNLSKLVLGFRSANDTLSSSVYAASYSNYNLSYDNYILMYIPTLCGMNASQSGQQSTFKIPLNTVNNQVYYYFEASSFKQWVDITDAQMTISSLQVILFDRFGYNHNPSGLDYSFTIWNCMFDLE